MNNNGKGVGTGGRYYRKYRRETTKFLQFSNLINCQAACDKTFTTEIYGAEMMLLGRVQKVLVPTETNNINGCVEAEETEDDY